MKATDKLIKVLNALSTAVSTLSDDLKRVENTVNAQQKAILSLNTKVMVLWVNR